MRDPVSGLHPTRIEGRDRNQLRASSIKFFVANKPVILICPQLAETHTGYSRQVPIDSTGFYKYNSRYDTIWHSVVLRVIFRKRFTNMIVWAPRPEYPDIYSKQTWRTYNICHEQSYNPGVTNRSIKSQTKRTYLIFQLVLLPTNLLYRIEVPRHFPVGKFPYCMALTYKT